MWKLLSLELRKCNKVILSQCTVIPGRKDTSLWDFTNIYWHHRRKTEESQVPLQAMMRSKLSHIQSLPISFNSLLLYHPQLSLSQSWPFLNTYSSSLHLPSTLFPQISCSVLRFPHSPDHPFPVPLFYTQNPSPNQHPFFLIWSVTQSCSLLDSLQVDSSP